MSDECRKIRDTLVELAEAELRKLSDEMVQLDSKAALIEEAIDKDKDDAYAHEWSVGRQEELDKIDRQMDGVEQDQNAIKDIVNKLKNANC